VHIPCAGRGDLLRSECLRDVEPIRPWRTHEAAIAANAIHNYVKAHPAVAANRG
jgi:hypothetical protein